MEHQLNPSHKTTKKTHLEPLAVKHSAMPHMLAALSIRPPIHQWGWPLAHWVSQATMSAELHW